LTENSSEPTPVLEEFPSVVVRSSSRFRLIWLVPIVAALVGIWLSVKATIEAGPTITIMFKSAEGLEAGITKIKYKDVEVGQVEAIRLSPDLSEVLVTATMVKEIENHLTENTRFWVVRARLTAGEVSGVGTLLSGVYIGMDPGKTGSPANQFIGLETPPVVTLDMPGTYYVLRADRLGSLDIGSPVYFHQIKVGQVVSYAVNADGSALDLNIFIQSPHDQRVLENTRFWNASGVEVSLDSHGLQINTDSLVSLLLGGVAFETPSSEAPGPVAAEGRIFYLYASRDKIQEPIYSERFYAIAYFDESVRGLVNGAGVEYKGIKVGEVVDIQLEYDPRQLAARVPVLMVLEPERLSYIGPGHAEADIMFGQLIEKGLSARLRTAIMLTGHRSVELVMNPDAANRSLSYVDGNPVIPTLAAPTKDIMAGISQLLSRIERLPMEEIGGDLQQSAHDLQQSMHDLQHGMQDLRQLMGSQDLRVAMKQLRQGLEQLNRFATTLNSDTAPQLAEVLSEADRALVNIQSTMMTAEHFMGAEAPLTYELKQMILELSKAGRAVSALADYLERHPEALISGKGAPTP